MVNPEPNPVAQHLQASVASIPSACNDEPESCKGSSETCSRAGSDSTCDSQTVTLEHFRGWHAQMGWVKGRGERENEACASLAFTFCCALHLGAHPACRVVLTTVRLLLACHFPLEDVEVCLAMTLAMMRSPRCLQLTANMGEQECVLVAMLHLYCAHSLVFDEFVHFKIWHEWLLAPFCNLKTSSSALRKVCALRKWRFVVPPPVLVATLAELRPDEGSDYAGSLPSESDSEFP